MATQQDILLTYRTDTGEVTKSFDEIIKGLEGVDKKAEDTAKKTGKIGDASKKAGKTGAQGFKILDVAMKATGILFIVDKFMQFAGVLLENKKVAETLEVVMAAIGTVMNQLFEVAEPLGEAIMNAFNNPMETIRNIGKAIKENLINRFEGMLEFLPAIGNAISLVFEGKWKEAGKVAADAAGKMVLGVEDITDKVAQAAEAVSEFASDFVADTKKAIQSSNDLTRAQQRLRDNQRDLNVEYAEARAEIEQLKKQRDDERLSIEERIAAAQEASDKDAEFATKRMDIANAEVALIQREIALQGETEERLDRLAEARIAAAEAAESSAAVQTELMTSIAGLQNEELARQQELIDNERERIDGIISRQSQIDDILEAGINREIEKVREKYRILQEDAAANGQILVGHTEAMEAEISAIRDQYAKEDKAREQEKYDGYVQMATNALGALMALNEANTGETEQEQRRAFEKNKKFQIAQAIIQTAQGVSKALSSSPPPLNFINAASLAATGIAQIRKIKKTEFDSGQDDSTETITRATAQNTSPQLDLGFLGGGAGQTGFRTYVVSSEVSNAQQANQRINDQASLVG